jgi:transketolase N-terminal domain/subunit
LTFRQRSSKIASKGSGSTSVDGSRLKPGEALLHVKAAVRSGTIEISFHAEAGHPERAITVAELLASLLAAGSATQQGVSNVWEILGPADPAMAARLRKRSILPHVSIRENAVVITCRRRP